ncbi:MAG: hypothetical protein GXP49_05830 [Deltaproteobacteria bacterium]|nr:hypothetical protein [Deltaproteobacteria bacterium]
MNGKNKQVLLISCMLFGMFFASCSTDVPANNPYDPDVPVGEQAKASLFGRVVLEQGDAGTAVVNVKPVGKSTRPDSEGRFEVRELSPGVYTVEVSAPGHSEVTQAGIYCSPGEQVDLGVMRLVAARGSLTGSVVLQLKPDEGAASNGGALVFARPGVSGAMGVNGDTGESTLTNPDGSWTITGLPVGRYMLNGSKEGFAPSPPVEVEIREDETTVAQALVLRSITGVIELDGGSVYTNDEKGKVTVRVLAFETEEMELSEDPEFKDPELGDIEWEPFVAEKEVLLSGGDGEKTLYGRFRNSDGYLTPPVYDTIVLDRQAPRSGSVEIAGGSEYVRSRQVSLKLSAVDELSQVSSMRISLDGVMDDESWEDFKGQELVELPLGEGEEPDGLEREVLVQYRDGAGNESEVVSDSVVLDSVSPRNPSITIGDGANYVSSVEVVLGLSAEGASEMEVSNDSGLSGAVWQPYSPALNWRLSGGDGVKSVYARFRDPAGNETDIVEATVTLDTRGGIEGKFLLEGASGGQHSGITVELLKQSGGELVDTTSTGEDGSFSFSSVVVGRYSLQGSKDGYVSAGVAFVEVGAGGVVDVGEHELKIARGSLYGKAYLEGAEAGGHGGIRVEVSGTDFSAVTVGDGGWRIIGVPYGQYTVRASFNGYKSSEQSDISVSRDGEEVLVPDLVLASNPGRVIGAVSLEGKSSPDLGGVTIVVAGKSGVSGGDGSFEIPGVPTGTHVLKASYSGYSSVERLVTVEAGKDTDTLELSMSLARGSIIGKALLSGASDNSGITVEVSGTSYSGSTGSEGNYRIGGVPVGTYDLTARKEGYSPGRIGVVTVEEDKTVTASEVLLERQRGDFVIEERASGDRNYLNDPAVRLVFNDVPPGSVDVMVSEESSFDGASWESFDTGAMSVDYDLTGNDGTITVYVKFRDSSRSESSVFASTVVLDREAPSGSMVIDNGASYSTSPDGDVSLTLTAEDATSGVSQVRISTDGVFDGEADQAFSTGISPVRVSDASSDGLKTVWVEFVDRAGNRSSAVSDSIYLDRLSPVDGSVSIERDASYTSSVLVTLGISARDACLAGYPDGDCKSGFENPSQMQVSNDSGFGGASWEPFASERAWFLKPGDGLKTVYVRFRDGAGNVSASVNDNIELDQHGPGSPFVEVQGGEVTGSRDVTLSLSATLAPVEMIVAENGDFESASWEPYTTSKGFRLSAGDGLKTVSAKFRDAAGNESVVASDTVTLDETAPSLFVVSIAGGAEYARSVNVDVGIDADGASGMIISEASDFSGANWSTYSSHKAFVLSVGDGLKTVYCKVRDEAGNESKVLSDTIELDTGVPVGSMVIDSGAQYSTDRQVVLSFSGVSSDVRQVMVSEDSGFSQGSWESYQAEMSWLLSAGDGQKTVYAKFRDSAGNESAAVSDGIELDTGAPTSVSVSVDEGSEVNSREITLSLSAVGADEMRVSESPGFDGASWEAYGTSKSWTLSSGDGQKVIYAQFRDLAGNESDVATAVVTLDTGEPYGPSISIDAGAEYATSRNVTLYLSAQDASEMRVSEDSTFSGVDWESYTSSKSWTLSSGEGSKTVYAVFRDEAGNVTEVVSDSIVLDTTAPSGSMAINTGDSSTTSRSVVLNFSAVSSDVSKVMVSEDSGFLGAVWQEYNSVLSWSLSSGDGTKTVYAKFRDGAGNESAAVSDSIVLDTNAPENPSVVIDGGAAYNNEPGHALVLTLSAVGASEMNIAEKQDFSVGTGWISYSTTYTYSLVDTGEGDKTIFVRYKDAAGNESEVVSDSIVHDVTAPSDGIVSIDSGATYCTAADGKVDLTLGASDTTSGLAKVLVSNDGSTWSEMSYRTLIVDWVLSSPANVDGDTRTVSVKFVDAAGNESAIYSDTITLDNVAPSSGSVVINDGDAYTADTSVHLTVSSVGATYMKISQGAACSGGSWQAYAGDVDWVLDDGGDWVTKSVSVVFKDDAGNISSPCENDSIHVDTVAPQLPSVVVEGGSLYNNDALGELDLTLSVLNATDMSISEEPTFATGTGWIAYVTSYTYALADKDDGEKTIYVKFKDAAGNESSVVNDSIIYDVTSPNGPYVMIDNDVEYTNDANGEVDLYLGASDTMSGLDTVEVSNTGAFSGEEVSYDYTAVLSGWALNSPTNVDGESRTVYVRYKDKAGNYSSSANDSIILDNVSPTGGALSIDSGATYTNDTSVQLTFSAAADVSEVSVSNTDVNCATALYGAYSDGMAWTLSSGDGMKTVYACLRDSAGNSEKVTDSIILDTTAPQVTMFNINSDAVFTTSSSVTLRYFGTDENGVDKVYASNEGTFSSPTELAFDSGTNPNVYNSWDIGSGDGTKDVFIKFVDAAGNETIRRDDIVLDTTSPENASITLEPGDYVSGASVTAHLSAVGVKFVCITGDIASPPSPDCTSASSPGWQVKSSSKPVTLSDGEGSKTVIAYFRDSAGNVAGPESDSVVRDDTSPSIGSIELMGLAADASLASQYTRDRNITVNFKSTSDSGPSGLGQMLIWEDAFGTCDPVPSGTWEEYKASSSFSLTSGDGDKVVCGVVRDNAGNESAASMAGIVLDTGGPQIPLTIYGRGLDGQDPDVSRSRKVTLDIGAVDETSAPYKMRLSRTSEFSGAWQDYADIVPGYDIMDPSVSTCRTLVVANEVDLGEPDRVELYNATSMDVQLKGWKLECWVGQNPSAPDVVWTLPSAVIPAWSYMVIDEGSGSSTDNYLYMDSACGWGSTTSDAGALVVKNAAGQEVDFVRWNGSQVTSNDSSGWSESAVLSCSDDCGRTSFAFDRNRSDDWCQQAESIASSNVGDCGLLQSDCVDPNGYKSLFVQVMDSAGNKETGMDDILIDMTPSSGNFTINDGSMYTSDAMVDLSINGFDELSGIADMAFTEDATLLPANLSWQPYSQTAQIFLDNSTDGQKMVFMALRDNAGNQSPLLYTSSDIYLDTTAPDSPCTLTVVNGNLVDGTMYVNSGFVDFQMGVNDNVSGVQYYEASENSGFTGASWVSFTEIGRVNLTSGDGVHTVYVRLKDQAGNRQENACGSVDVYQDTQVPKVTLSLPGLNKDGEVYYTNSHDLNIDVDCQDTYCDKILIDGDVIDGGAGYLPVGVWSDYGTNHSGLLKLSSGDGPHNVRVTVADAAQNLSAPEVATVHVDTQVPVAGTVTLNGLGAGGPSTSYTRDRGVTVSLSGFSDDDQLKQMMVSESPVFAGASWQDYQDMFSWTLSGGDGVKSLYVKVRDRSGNVNAAPNPSGQITLDTLPPIVDMTITGTGPDGADSNYTKERIVDLAINVNDLGGSGAEKMELSRTGSFSGTWAPFAGTVPAFDLVDPVTPTCRTSGVIINEIFTDNPDQAELLNETGYPVDLTGWTFECAITTNSVVWSLPDFTLQPQQYVILDEGTGVNTQDHLYFGANCLWQTGNGYGVLRNGEGEVVDYIAFGTSPPAPPVGTGWTADKQLLCDATTCGRNSNGFDRDLSSDWCNQVSTLGSVNIDACGLVPGVDCTDIQGSRPVYVTVRDYAGNVSTASSSIVLDVEAPAGGITINQNDEFTNNNIVSLSMSYSDDVSGILDMKLGETFNSYGVFQDAVDTLTYSLSQPDGKVKTYVRYRDRAGNVSPGFSDDIILDTLGPSTCSVEFNDLTTPTNERVKALAIAYADDTTAVADIILSEDPNFGGASWQPAVNNQDWVLSSNDGNKRVYIKCRDEAGNEALGTNTTEITLDQTPPSASFVSIDGGAGYTNDSQRRVDLTYGYQGDAYVARISNYPNFSSYTQTTNLGSYSNWQLTFGDGQKTVYVMFLDQAGNQSGIVSDTIVLDTQAPSITQLYLDGCNLYAGTEYCAESLLSLRIDSTGCYEVCLTHDGNCDTEPWEPYSYYKSYSLPAVDNSYTVSAVCRDQAGNLSNTDSVSLVLDMTPPDAPQVITPSQKVNRASISVTRTNVPDVDTHFLRWECKGGSSYPSWTSCSTLETNTIFSFNLTQDMDNVLQIRAVDNALNASDPGWVTIKEDSTAPPSMVINEVINRDHAVTLKWASSSASDVQGYRIYYDYEYNGTDKSLYTGTFANEGQSPIDVGNLTSFTLTGLSNGIGFYVSIDAYDDTSDPGPNASALGGSVEARPNRVSPELESVFTTIANASSITVQGEYLYVSNGTEAVAIDASDPTSLKQLSSHTWSTNGKGGRLIPWGRYIYAIDYSDAGIQALRSTPRNLYSWDYNDEPNKAFKGFYPQGNYAYGVYWDNSSPGWKIGKFSFNSTTGPYLTTELEVAFDEGVPNDIWAADGYVFVATNYNIWRYSGVDLTGKTQYTEKGGQRVKRYRRYMFIGDDTKMYEYYYGTLEGGAFDGCTDFEVGGNYVYCVTNYPGKQGLNILDIRDPTHVELVGQYRGVAFSQVALSGGYVYALSGSSIYVFRVATAERVEYSSGIMEDTRSNTAYGNYIVTGGGSSQDTRLRVINVMNPDDISQEAAFSDTANSTNVLALDNQGEYAFFNQPSNQVWIMNIGNNFSPVHTGTVTTGGTIYDVEAWGNYLLILRNNNSVFRSWLEIWDVRDRTASQASGQYLDYVQLNNSNARDIYVSGGYAHVGMPGYYQIVNLTNPTSLSIAATVSPGGTVTSVYVNGDYAYLALGSSGFKVYDISVITAPVLVKSVTGVNVYRCYGSGKYLFTGNTLRVWDVSDPANPQKIIQDDQIDFVQGISQMGSNLYISGFEQGLSLWQITR